MSGEPTPEEGKYKDIPSILPLAPGGVYAVKWEQREKWAECLRTPDVPYTPPLGAPNPDNPVCFFEIRAGGYYLGRVTFELKADTHPVTSENFLKLCEFKCYAATKFKVFPGNWIRGGDFTDLDEVVYDANDPDFFDFDALLPRAPRRFLTERLRVRRRAVLRGRVLRHHARQAWGFDDVPAGFAQLQRQPVHDPFRTSASDRRADADARRLRACWRMMRARRPSSWATRDRRGTRSSGSPSSSAACVSSGRVCDDGGDARSERGGRGPRYGAAAPRAAFGGRAGTRSSGRASFGAIRAIAARVAYAACVSVFVIDIDRIDIDRAPSRIKAARLSFSRARFVFALFVSFRVLTRARPRSRRRLRRRSFPARRKRTRAVQQVDEPSPSAAARARDARRARERTSARGSAAADGPSVGARRNTRARRVRLRALFAFARARGPLVVFHPRDGAPSCSAFSASRFARRDFRYSSRGEPGVAGGGGWRSWWYPSHGRRAASTSRAASAVPLASAKKRSSRLTTASGTRYSASAGSTKTPDGAAVVARHVMPPEREAASLPPRLRPHATSEGGVLEPNFAVPRVVRELVHVPSERA